MVRYPHDRYIRWLIAKGAPYEEIIDTCTKQYLYVNTATFSADVEIIRKDMIALGGKTARPRLTQGTGRAPTKKVVRKMVGTPYDLSDDQLRGMLETLLRVRPVRRMIQILSAKKLSPEIIAHQLQTRFDMEIEAELVQAFCDYYWDVPTTGYAGLWEFIQIIPEKDKDRDFFTTCLDKPLHYIYYRLGVEGTMQFNEIETMRAFLSGAYQNLMNSLHHDLNPSGSAPVAWMGVIDAGREIYYDALDRNKEEGARDTFRKFQEHVALKKAEPLKLPVIGDLENVG